LVGLRSKLTGAESTEFHVRTAERYAELLGRSKDALMKAGQMLSFASASPAVPAEFQSIYQAALTRLRDDMPPMAPELARGPVIHRKLSHGTRSHDGERFIERALSASVTCRLQHRSLFAYLRELLTAHNRGDPLPTLT
jgi:hypothetical protein